jgi:hypothetical protein
MKALQSKAPNRRPERYPSFGSTAARRPAWHDLAHRFTGERECLASYLALEAAEVIGGAKPANLINLLDWQRPCGRNIYRLWLKHGQQLLAQSGLAAFELAQREKSVLLLIFHPQQLAGYLETPKVANFLRRAGYRRHAAMADVLTELQSRCTAADFPHEIGAILGYPLKDVAGFMGWVNLPVTGQGPWKIYGDPRPSLDAVAACRSCRETMARRLDQGENPFSCLCSPDRMAFRINLN